MIYENKFAYFIWKPAGVPSTWGEKPSLLVQLEQGAHGFYGGPDDHWMGNEFVREMIVSQMRRLQIVPVENSESVCNFLLHTFSREEEYGLLNRLDTPTSGFLYFAKSREQYQSHRSHQKGKKIRKHYIAQVHGDIRYQFADGEGGVFEITFPLMHHAHLDDRMVAIVHDSHKSAGRGVPQDSLSKVHLLGYHDELDQSFVHVIIHQGRRHQIRAHTAGAGYPIVGDHIYGKKHHGDQLHLRSIGVDVGDDIPLEDNDLGVEHPG